MNSPKTLEDVANLANVSTATVSRCINDSAKVKPSTRKKVNRAIKTLNYTPNFGARVLAARKTNIIGAIIPTMENAIFASGIQAFQESLTDAGCTLLISSSSYQRKLEEAQIYNLISHGADALLLIGEDRNPEIYKFLKQRNIPYVLAWNFKEPSSHYFVGFDNRETAKISVNQAVALGHKHIAIIAGLTADNDRARDRLSGFIKAFEDAKLAIPEQSIIECEYSFEDAGNATEKIMSNFPKTTAIVCGNDVLAVGAIMRAHKLGISVPKQLSIIGFDDIEIANIVTPKLSTVHVPHRQMGVNAAKLIVSLLNNKESAGKSIRLEPRFISRESLTIAP